MRKRSKKFDREILDALSGTERFLCDLFRQLPTRADWCRKVRFELNDAIGHLELARLELLEVRSMEAQRKALPKRKAGKKL